MADEEIVKILKEKSDKEAVEIYNSKKRKKNIVTSGDSNVPVIQRNSMKLSTVYIISSAW